MTQRHDGRQSKQSLADIDFKKFHHPCPKKIHHPGEQCICSCRLDIQMPHGHSRLADQGDIHVARLQNLRWRLSAPCRKGKSVSLPTSFRILAKDHPGDVAEKAVRPLSPICSRRAKHSVIVIGGEKQIPRLRKASVTFHEDIEAEIPHFVSKPWKLVKVPSKREALANLRADIQKAENPLWNCFEFLLKIADRHLEGSVQCKPCHTECVLEFL